MTNTRKYSVFESLQDGSKQESVAFMVYCLLNGWRHNFKSYKNFKLR